MDKTIGMLVMLELIRDCLGDGVVEGVHNGVVHSYIENYIITRELIFLVSIIALVISWRVLVHVVFHRHRVIRKIINFKSYPPVAHALDYFGGVFDEAMNVYGDDEDDSSYYYEEGADVM